jgi:predicted nucleotide-binding protein
MPGRFSGADGHRHLVNAIQRQHLVRGDAELAHRLAAIATVEPFAKGASLTVQGNDGNDLYLLLTGRVAVVIKGQEMAQRSAGTHVGEMSLIDRTERRSASCIALEDTVAARIAEPAFTELAGRFPVLWRNIALVLGDRLRQRTAFIRMKNETPVIFIGSSRESLEIAYGIQAGLSATTAVVHVWPHGIFRPSNFPIEDLERELELADLAVLVFGPDDKVLSRRVFGSAPRDNLVFEAGLFMGALRRQRTLIIKSRRIKLKVPSDLFGLTPIEFDRGSSPDLGSCLEPVCAAIAECVARHGAR